MPLRPIHNYPVVPEEGAHYRRCRTKPVTRAELQCDFRTGFFLYSPEDVIALKALLDYGLGSVTFFYTSLWLRTRDGKEIPGGREAMRRLAEGGIYLLHMGLVGTNEEVAPFNELLIEAFGERYLGAKADSEVDGGYTAGWCWGSGGHAHLTGMTAEPSPERSRAQARREYDQVLACFYRHPRNVSICSLGYGCHYAAEQETRMLGVETVEKLPCDNLLWCFCRGAAKQYDLLTSVSISSAVQRPWGSIGYYPDGRSILHPGAKEDQISGPGHGFSEGLSRREWFLAYMYGASVAFCQGAHLYTPLPYPNEPPLPPQYEGPLVHFQEANRPSWALLEGVLTPLGRILAAVQEVAYDHPVRGVPYMPVALMLDEDHGWNPPRHLYRKDQDHVWANIPYSRLDYQIDNFFRWVYPDYHLSSYYRDERGYLTNTPFGDLFEVILSNASSHCLEKYRTVVLLGDLQVEARPELSERLTRFLESGGTVILGAEQWPTLPAALAGAEPGDARRRYAGEVRAADGRTFREPGFEHCPLRVTTAEVLLSTAGGEPLVVQQRVGQGRIVLVGVRGWGRNEGRHEFLRGIRHVLGLLLQELALVEIDGRPIFSMLNVTDREDELILTLCNNSPDVQWEGKVRIKGEEIDAFDAWLGHSEAGIQAGALHCAVPANDVRIFSLQASRGFLPLMFQEIDWRKLGVGIPEVDLRNHPARRMSHF